MRKYLLLGLSLLALIPLSQTYAYPGCDRPDILVGGQIWAGCNSTSLSKGSSYRSGWFFSGNKTASFLSYNGWDQRLSFQGKNMKKDTSWVVGPCATGYRLPSRGEYETAIYYARLNGTTVADLLRLPLNGSYKAYRDSDGDLMVESRTGVDWAYWTSSSEDIYGLRNIVLHIGSSYGGYRTDGTDMVYDYDRYTWQYDDTGLELVGGEVSELANVRCIRS